MISLKRAIQQNRIEQFIAEHKDEIGDLDAFNRTVEAMAGTSKAVPEASSQDEGDD